TSPRAPTRPAFARPRVLVVVAALLLVTACTGGPSPSPSPSASASGSAPSGAGSSPRSDLTAGLSAPLSITPVQQANLDNYQISLLASTKSGQVWAAADKMNANHTNLGVWHGTVGRPGTFYPIGNVGGIAVAPDGSPWIAVGTSLLTYRGGAWRSVVWPSEWTVVAVSNPMVAPDGVVWAGLSSSDQAARERNLTLLRYDGTATRLPGLPFHPMSGRPELVMAADGSVWTSSGSVGDPGIAELGGLQRYDGTALRSVRPLGGTKDVPALVAADPQGPVWAYLVDVEPVAGTTGQYWTGSRALARFDGTAWTTFTGGLPDGIPTSMVAVKGVVWAVMAVPVPWETPGPVTTGLYRFDGTSWSPITVASNLDLNLDLSITDVLSANPDGTVWVLLGSSVLRHVSPGLPW
ncbi:MAG TPA: hypothetical protein VIM19_18090, partial [Actinomycetes bacterium]